MGRQPQFEPLGAQEAQHLGVPYNPRPQLAFQNAQCQPPGTAFSPSTWPFIHVLAPVNSPGTPAHGTRPEFPSHLAENVPR